MNKLIPPALAQIAHRIGRRGSFLLFLVLLDWIYAYSLAFPTATIRHNSTYGFLAEILPLWAWSLLWMGIGTTCLVFAFRHHDAPGYAAAMFLNILWALIFLLGWIFAEVERGYLSTAIWGAFAAILGLIATWPEPEPGRGQAGPIERSE